MIFSEKIGYILVCLTSQNPSRQFQQLNVIGMDIIFVEKVSEATKDREQLQKMIKNIQEKFLKDTRLDLSESLHHPILSYCWCKSI